MEAVGIKIGQLDRKVVEQAGNAGYQATSRIDNLSKSVSTSFQGLEIKDFKGWKML